MGFVTDTLFGEPPQPPNPAESASDQMAINEDAIINSILANQVNQSGPGFDIRYSGDPLSPGRRMEYSLSEPRQRLADIINAQMITGTQRLNPNYQLPRMLSSGDAYTSDAADAMYDALSSRLNRFQGNRYDRTVNELTQRGLPIGQEAWTDEMQNLMQAETDEQLQIARAAQELGISEASRLFGQDFAQQQFRSGLDLSQRADQRNQLAQLMSINPENFVQMPGMPAFQMAPADLMGAQQSNYQGQLNAYNARMGGMADLGGAAMMAFALSHPSTKRDKKPISAILPRIDQLKVEAWRYKPNFVDGGAVYHIGPYADQFHKLFGVGDGITINLMDAIGVLFAAVQELHAELKAHTMSH